ncbi:MAG: TlpA family protein disulfide reductase [Candidatus Marinimicrobia bacterium]|nr:TlpA family protein disulfide reductase [Candidatus Neomarinimicrobiota bacterium]MCF7850788.1 TlpA family protein disulfide reductase [Candidatus Neomarinimicrobiota bacterium]MCF7904802.1 TlpA family protein disulfide reductase [Candidatus Neomarinimicrobiota bacterium]
MKQIVSLLLFLTLAFGAGNTLPDLKLKDLKNTSQSTQELTQGKITLINFWATYCVPCRKEMKHLNRIDQSYQKQGVQVIGVAIDDSRTVGRVKSLVRSQKLQYLILLDTEQTFYKNFSTNAMPFSILVDAEGSIIWEHTGYIPGDEVTMEDEIKKAIKEQQTSG